MKKKIGIGILLLSLLLPLLAFGGEQQRVIDPAGIFTAEETRQLEEAIGDFREKYQMDMVILTNREKHSKTVQAYADDYYDDHGFGMGSDNRGFLLFYDLYQSDFHITTTGLAIDILTDSRLSDFGNAFIPLLRSAKNGKSGYGSAFLEGIRLLGTYVEKGIPAGHTRIAQKSEYVGIVQKRLTLMEIVISAAIALGVGLAVSLGTLSSYRLKGRTYSYDYRQKSTVRITHRVDQFMMTTHHRVRIPRDSDSHSGGGGSSSVHISSGGHSHGGGSFHV